MLKMPLFPKSREQWTRSLARPLLFCCAALLLFSFCSMGQRFWRYGGPSIGGGLLPVMGLALALVCLVGKGLDRDFRTMAWIIAFLSVFGGLLFLPALAN
jgi:hypothetical protein